MWFGVPIQMRGVRGIREVCGRSTPLAPTARGLPIPANVRDLFPGWQVPSANSARLPGKPECLIAVRVLTFSFTVVV